MEVDKVRPGKISPEEREKILKEGRCFRCGGKDHFSYQCTPEDQQKSGTQTPKPTQAPGRRINAVDISDGQGGVTLDPVDQDQEIE